MRHHVADRQPFQPGVIRASTASPAGDRPSRDMPVSMCRIASGPAAPARRFRPATPARATGHVRVGCLGPRDQAAQTASMAPGTTSRTASASFR